MRNFANLDAVPAGLRRANGCPILRIPFRPFPQLPFRRLGTSALTPNSAWDLRVAPLTSYVSRHLVARWTGWTLGLDGAFQPTDVRRTMPCPALVPQGLSPTEPPSKKKKAWVGDGRGGTLAGFLSYLRESQRAADSFVHAIQDLLPDAGLHWFIEVRLPQAKAGADISMFVNSLSSDLSICLCLT